ncbi:hypothetical protein NHX12_006335 [Muraenolepis orangiensis]|uniref:Uncharacterized protein n=1 Tax=Muraenolepis orangiensis TaxID=630683 RepID=A0A9Q0DUW8_9TELE|nr:hypothetical protein NHX12_006335 [Muraenolepis orangiensis]
MRGTGETGEGRNVLSVLWLLSKEMLRVEMTPHGYVMGWPPAGRSYQRRLFNWLSMDNPVHTTTSPRATRWH